MRFRRKIGLSLLSAMLLLGSLGGVPHVHVYADEHKVMVLPFENNVEDQSGLGNHGTIVGDEYTYVDGVIGKALKLEGNAYLELGTGSALHPEAMTLAFWIRPNGPLAGEHVITRAESAGGGQVWHLASEDDDTPLALTIKGVDGGFYKASLNLPRPSFFPADEWTHVIVAYDPETGKAVFYRNGVKQDTVAAVPVDPDNAREDALTARIALDEFEVYNVPASEELAVTVYNEQVARADAARIELPAVVAENLELPSTGYSGSVITWQSSDEERIDARGGVRRPEAGTGHATVTLTATVMFGNGIATRDFHVTVLAEDGAAFAAEAASLEESQVLSLSFEDNLTDDSGLENHGTIVGSNYAYIDGVKGKALKLDGNTYINLGTSGTLQPSSLTLSFWIKPNAFMSGEHMIIWNKTYWYSNGWYVSSENDNTPLAISLGPANTNQQPYKVSVKTSRADFFPTDQWTHVAITYNGDTKEVNIYRNGIRQPLNVDYPINPAVGADGVIRADDVTQKSIGYNGPMYRFAYARVAFDEFQIYSVPLTQLDVIRLYEEQSGRTFDYAAIAQADADALVLPARAVTHLALPTQGWNGSTIAWTSSNETVIAPDGTVRRPAEGESDAVVTLTATVTFGSASVTREFNVIVPARTVLDVLEDVEMSQVLLTDPYYVNAFEKEIEYLLSLEPDKLLSYFRSTAGLTPKASPYGGWENTEIRGHTLGHYLSALSQAYANARGDLKNQLKERLDYIVDELALVQEAHGNGYVSAFPEEFLDRVERGQPVWVPWYTMHKILAGLISAATHGESAKALEVAKKLGEYVYNRTSRWDEATRNRVLSVEYGGMNDALYDLYILTKDEKDSEKYLRAAEKFDEHALFDELYRGNGNVLVGKHANTTIPKVIGALKRYIALEQAESEEYYLIVAQNFWDMVVNDHTYITGGNSENEHFGLPDILDAERTNVNNETCNVYNMLKLTRELFKITKDKKYADFYENAFTNHIMASQHPQTGMTTYFQAMATGYFKVFGSPFSHFWCCTGTGMENFTKLNDSVYFRKKGNLYVNMYLSSTVTLEEENLVLHQESELPNTGKGDASTGKVKFTVNTTGETNTALRFRIPDWAPALPTVTVNGAVLEQPVIENGYIVLQQNWADGTEITLDFPMEVTLHNLPDGPNTVAFKYGPVVLAAGLGTHNMTTSPHGVQVLKANKDNTEREFITVLASDIESWKQNVKENVVKREGKLEFVLRGTDADNGALVFKPYFQLYDERYGIYFKLVTENSPEYQQAILNAKDRGRLEAATISFVIVANDQYELAANRQAFNSNVGVFNGKPYRDASPGGWFSYDMEVVPGIPNYLFMTYYSGDVGREFNIYIDDQLLVRERIENRNPGNFYNQIRQIPQEWVDGSRTKTVTETGPGGEPVERQVHYVTVRFASTGGFVGGLFDIFRVIKSYENNPNLKSLRFDTGVLSPGFDPEHTEYTLTVPRDTESVTMTVEPADEYGLVYVGGLLIDDNLPRKVVLAGDRTELVLTAKAEDHVTERQYTVQIVKGDLPEEEPPLDEEPGEEEPGEEEPGEEPGEEEPGEEEPGEEEPGDQEPGEGPGHEQPGGEQPGVQPGDGQPGQDSPGTGGSDDVGVAPGTGGQPGGEDRPDAGTPPADRDVSSEPPEPVFADVRQHWAKDAIGRMASSGIMQGYADGSFRPDRKMTRAELATVLVRLLDLQPMSGDTAFSDVRAGDWHAGYVHALHKAGIINGYADGTFRPNQQLTREEAFVMIWRAVKDRLEVSGPGRTFTDEADVSPWALEAVRALAAAGLIRGYEDGSLRPKQPITRAEAAAILAVLLER